MCKARRWWFAALLAAGCESGSAPTPDAAAFADASGAEAGGGLGADASADAAGARSPCRESDPQPCPPTGYATWPMPTPPGVPLPHTAAYAVMEGTVIDKVTGLEWQRSFTDKQTWQEAKTTCGELSLGGHSDWRLPSRIELVSLVDYTRLPTIDHAAFPNTADDYFWSSSVRAADAQLAYSVYFGAGLTAYGDVMGASGHTRCVRGGAAGASPRFRIEADMVHDLNTGLTWQRRVPAEPLTWQTGLDLCQELGFRLPTTKELQTLVDETRAAPVVDPEVFPDTPAAIFWTSTPVNKAGVSNAVYLDFRDGGSEEAPMLDAHHIRCVR